jgi:hypothetical protein
MHIGATGFGHWLLAILPDRCMSVGGPSFALGPLMTATAPTRCVSGVGCSMGSVGTTPTEHLGGRADLCVDFQSDGSDILHGDAFYRNGSNMPALYRMRVDCGDTMLCICLT